MQLGLTWPLQRHLHTQVPYGEPESRMFCWDLHCITLQGRSSLLLVHCASRYTCVLYDMTKADWDRLADVAQEEIRNELMDAGLAGETVERYMKAAGTPQFTRTHGRREVAFLNRAWEAVLRADFLVDPSQRRQPALNEAVNDLVCRCAEYDDKATALEFLRRCFGMASETDVH